MRHATIAASVLLIAGAMGAAQAPKPLSREDKALLWDEAMATFNGRAYTYTLYTFPSKTEAQACLGKDGESRLREHPNKMRVTQRYNELPYALRPAFDLLPAGSCSDPIPHPNGRDWVVLAVEAVNSAKFSQEVDPEKWLGEFAATALPSPEALRTRPELVARHALNAVSRAEDLKAVLASGKVQPAHLNAPLSNGLGPLTMACIMNQPALVNGLLDAGASPDGSAEECTSPLVAVAAQKYLDLARLLLLRKANPNGAGRGITPLMAACMAGDREIAQLLLDAGADPWATRPFREGLRDIPRNAAYFVQGGTPFAAWWDGALEQALAKTGDYEWTAWVEQGGRRQPVVQDATLTLKHAAFKVVVRMKAHRRFRVVTCENPKIMEFAREFSGFRRDLLKEAHVSTLGPQQKFLTVATFRAKDGKPDFAVPTDEWTFPAPAKAGAEASGEDGATEFVHEIAALKYEDGTLPVAQYRANGLVVVMGVIPEAGGGADFYKPLGFLVKFQP